MTQNLSNYLWHFIIGAFRIRVTRSILGVFFVFIFGRLIFAHTNFQWKHLKFFLLCVAKESVFYNGVWFLSNLLIANKLAWVATACKIGSVIKTRP